MKQLSLLPLAGIVLFLFMQTSSFGTAAPRAPRTGTKLHSTDHLVTYPISQNYYGSLEYEARVYAEKILAEVFAGGSNLQTSITNTSFYADGSLKEIRIKMSFNGNVVRSNYYQCTLILKDTSLHLDFTDVTDNANLYILLSIEWILSQKPADMGKLFSQKYN